MQLNCAFRGNKTEASLLMVVMICLGAFCIFTNVYFLAWQTYIMWIELVLHLGAVAFTATEMCVAGFAIFLFKNADSVEEAHRNNQQ